jgi:apolipoprotein N-acyltransferase
MGVSAVIDGNGRVLKPTQSGNADPPIWTVRPDALKTAELPMSQWHEFKSKHGVLKVAVPLDTRFSFYVLTGDWVPIGCWLVLIGAAAWSIVSRRRQAAMV